MFESKICLVCFEFSNKLSVVKPLLSRLDKVKSAINDKEVLTLLTF
jgi:hypothetical protein